MMYFFFFNIKKYKNKHKKYNSSEHDVFYYFFPLITFIYLGPIYFFTKANIQFLGRNTLKRQIIRMKEIIATCLKPLNEDLRKGKYFGIDPRNYREMVSPPQTQSFDQFVYSNKLTSDLSCVYPERCRRRKPP